MNRLKPEICRQNGFTLVEMMVVLLIASLGVLISVSRAPSSFSLFMEQMQSAILQAQMEAVTSRSTKKVNVEKTYMQAESSRLEYPDGVACEPVSFAFNARGNITSAGTIHCSTSESAMKIVLQLGSGRMRIEAQ